MEKDIRWIKISVGLFSDDKIRLIRAMEHGNELVLIWIQLLLLAGRVNRDGLLMLSGTDIPYSEEMMAGQFETDPSLFRRALDLFIRYGMVQDLNGAYSITNWSKHQSSEGLQRIREQNRARKQAERERNRNALSGGGRPTSSADWFERFWKAYPKKVGRIPAEKAFARCKPTEELTERMIRALEKAKRSEAWQRENGRFIPNPATWLNQHRWEDEIPEAPEDRRLENWDEWNK